MLLIFTFSKCPNLRIHLKTNSQEKSNKCKQNDYASSFKYVLREHLKHSGEKSNKCKQCDFKNAHSGNLRRHLKTHNGEKSNKCNQCDYASSQPSNLKIHFKTRSGENAIPILLFFASAGHLRAHLKKHSGQKYKNCHLRWM